MQWVPFLVNLQSSTAWVKFLMVYNFVTDTDGLHLTNDLKGLNYE